MDLRMKYGQRRSWSDYSLFTMRIIEEYIDAEKMPLSDCMAYWLVLIFTVIYKN